MSTLTEFVIAITALIYAICKLINVIDHHK